ncbi:hypothetical protein [Streptomyces cucumeris]|uniref:hypothetical protein n=1 Tax=Streptomyces cucumeris TaxID=2962890 RepID=UPI003D74AD84
MQMRAEDSASLLAPGVVLAQRHASSFGFFGGALTRPGHSLARPRWPSSTSALPLGSRWNCSAMPSVRTAVWSCMRPGWT